MRAAEALLARDYAVHQMENAVASLNSKECTIAQLQAEKATLEAKLASLSLGNAASVEHQCVETLDTAGVAAIVKENTDLKERLHGLQAFHKNVSRRNVS